MNTIDQRLVAKVVNEVLSRLQSQSARRENRRG